MNKRRLDKELTRGQLREVERFNAHVFGDFIERFDFRFREEQAACFAAAEGEVGFQLAREHAIFVTVTEHIS